MRKHAVRIMLLLFLAASPAAAADDDVAAMPTPLKNAVAGQWVQYRVNTLFGSVDQKQTLVDIQGDGDDRVLTIKTEISVDEELMDERTDSVTLGQALKEQEDALAEAQNLSARAVSIEFKGRKLDAVEIRYTQDGEQCVLHLSNDVPIVGLITMEVEGMSEPAMELLDFGE